MPRWLDPKLLSVAAILMVAQQGLKLSQVEWTAEDLGAATVTVVLGALFWGIVATFVKNLLNRK